MLSLRNYDGIVGNFGRALFFEVILEIPMPTSAKRPLETIRIRTRNVLPARELYPELNDPIKGPALSFHGMRLKQSLTQI